MKPDLHQTTIINILIIRFKMIKTCFHNLLMSHINDYKLIIRKLAEIEVF